MPCQVKEAQINIKLQTLNEFYPNCRQYKLGSHYSPNCNAIAGSKICMQRVIKRSIRQAQNEKTFSPGEGITQSRVAFRAPQRDGMYKYE